MQKSGSREQPRSPSNRPFYLPPTSQPTAADIIRESRDWLQSVSTRRPSTPKQPLRSLFNHGNSSHSRPSSTSSTRSDDGDAMSSEAQPACSIYESKSTQWISNRRTLLSPPPTGSAAEAAPFFQSSARPGLSVAESGLTDRLSCPKRSEDPDIHAKVPPSILISLPKAFDALELPGSRLGPPLLTPLTSTGNSKSRLQKRRGTTRKSIAECPAEHTLNNMNSASEVVNSTKKVAEATTKVSSRSIELWRLIHALSALSLDLDLQPHVKNPAYLGNSSTVANKGPSSSEEVDRELAEAEVDPQGPVNVGIDDALAIISTIQKRLESFSREEVDAWQVQSELTKLIIRMTRHRSPRLRISLAHLALQIRVKGDKLVHICTLFYQLAKDPRNDKLFAEDEELCGRMVCLLSELRLPLVETSFGQDDVDNEYCRVELRAHLEALLYLSAALKFLTASPQTGDIFCQETTARALAAVHTDLEATSAKIDAQISLSAAQTSHSMVPCSELANSMYDVLLQVTEMFCTLSTQPEEWWSLLIYSGIVKTVLDALTRRAASASPPTDAIDQGSRRDVFLNWARLMAHLTEHASFCHNLLGDLERDDFDVGETACINFCRPTLDGVQCCKDLVQLILLRSSELDFVVRLAYALGNIAARCSFARSAILCNRQVLEEVCHLCQRQASKVMRKFATGGSAGAQNSAVLQDALVKLIRMIVNATIDVEPGILASVVPECICLLIDITRFATTEQEELLLNSLAGLNNITFYMDSETQPYLISYQKGIAKVCLQVLVEFSNHEEVVLGAVRVLGNLTSHLEVRKSLAHLGIWSSYGGEDDLSPGLNAVSSFCNLLIDMLNSNRLDSVYCTLGVITNLMLEPEYRCAFRDLHGCHKLVETLRVNAGVDWQLSSLACQALANFIEDPTSPTFESLGLELEHELESLLSDLVDPDVVNSLAQEFDSNCGIKSVDSLHTPVLYQQHQTTDFWKFVWSSDFLPVASDLLSRLRIN
uniref:Armadillo repeat-containing protein 2 n=2 Tax=Schistocephalus solidus TaxID=70667 RepID=A0A0V0J9J2_SCHSO